MQETYTAPRTKLEQILSDLLKETLQLEQVGIYDDFFELGGDSISGLRFTNRIQEELKERVNIVAVFEATSITKLAEYFTNNYAEAVNRLVGDDAGVKIIDEAAKTAEDVMDEHKIEEMRIRFEEMISAGDGNEPAAKKIPPAVFVLGPPRSGSTLFRVMLGGHPGLFSPPELYLMTFNTLKERGERLGPRLSAMLSDGIIRAIMELQGCGVEKARQIYQDFLDRDFTVQQFYEQIGEWAGGRMIVDKTPNYPLSLTAMRRMERLFDKPFYIHLIRNPYGMIYSFKEARLDLTFEFEEPIPKIRLAEYVWVVANTNVMEFLKSVPLNRQLRLKFEDLVTQPDKSMEAVSRFLGIEFESKMINPYDDREGKMTDGVSEGARMVGDFKFSQYKNIDPGVADRWKLSHQEDFLSDSTKRAARMLGYDL